MPFLSKMISFWNNFFRRQSVERDLNDELQAYVEEMTERKIQAGLAPDTAREAVLLELGGIERIKDLVRQQRVGLGNLRTATAMVIVALVAFVSGASASIAAMRWSTPTPVALPVAETKPPSRPMRLPVLQGRVVDKATGEPVPYVEVGLQALAPFRRYTFTDEKGQFGFTNPPPQGFRLEAGSERWFINGSGDVGYSFNLPRSDRFSVTTPNVVVRDKNGKLLEGKRIESKGFVSFNTDPKLRDLLNRSRSFTYSSGTIELPVTRLPLANKRASFGFGTPTIDVQEEIKFSFSKPTP